MYFLSYKPIEAHQEFRFCLSRKKRNNGPPNRAVTTPTDNPVGPRHLATMSLNINIRPPMAAEHGIRYLALEPTSMRAMCGHTNPTKPIVPVKQTAIAVASEMTTRQRILMRVGFSPNVLEGLSPAIRTFNLLDMNIMNAKIRANATMRYGMEDHPKLPSVPTDHA